MPHLKGWAGSRLRPDRHGRLGQARRLRAGPLPLRRAARLPVRAVGRARSRRSGDPRAARLGFGAGLRLGQPAPRPRAGHRLHGGHRHAARRGPTGPARAPRLPGLPLARGRADGAGARTCSSSACCRARSCAASARRRWRTTASLSPSPARIDAPRCRGRARSRSRASRADVVAIVERLRRLARRSDVPKLFINAEPGAILTGPQREFVRSWPNQTEVTVPGVHFIQEDSPDEIGAAVAQFVRQLRG